MAVLYSTWPASSKGEQKISLEPSESEHSAQGSSGECSRREEWKSFVSGVHCFFVEYTFSSRVHASLPKPCQVSPLASTLPVTNGR